MDKILVTVRVPRLEESFDFLIPIFDRLKRDFPVALFSFSFRPFFRSESFFALETEKKYQKYQKYQKMHLHFPLD